MGAIPDITPEYYQILIIRELRKAGLDVGDPTVHRRSELPEPQRGFVLELLVSLSGAGWRTRALLACYRQEDLVRREIVTPLPSRITAARAECGILVTTAGFDPDAIAAAEAAGILLLAVVDSRKAYDPSGWGGEGHYPAWLPAHGVQQVGRDPDGTVRLRPLAAASFQARR
jgi:hypothetical protein